MKRQLGHHSIKVTVDVYGHLVPGANKAAVDRLAEQASGATIGQARAPRGAVRSRAGIARNPTATPAATSGPPNAARGHGVAP